MKVLGLPVMKALFRILYAESKLTGKPIVFLGHPIELVRKMNFTRNWKKHLIKYTKPKYFSPSYIRIHGIQLRSLLYRHDEETFARYTGELFTYMNSFPDVKFITLQDYSPTKSIGGKIINHNLISNE